MRKYKVPGAYAHFIPTENTVQTTGQIRVLALVGTGQQSFEKENVFITRKPGSIADELPDNNILEVYSVSSKPITKKIDTSNKTYTNYKLKNDHIVWEQLTGPQYDAKIETSMGKGDNGFLANISTSIIDPNFLVDEKYKLEISYVDRDGIGTYVVSKMSTSEVIGEYVADLTFKDDIIPGVKLKVDSTFVLDSSSHGKSKTSIGDYAIIQTIAAKCHVDPKIDLIQNTGILDADFVLVNGGSNFNIVGDGKAVVDTVTNWPKISNDIKITRSATSLKYQISLYKNGVLTNVDNLFSKFAVTARGSVAGVARDTNVLLFDSSASVGPTAAIVNSYDITSSLGLGVSATTDNFELQYNYVLKDDVALDNTNIVIHLNVIDSSIVTGNNKLIDADNLIYIRNSVIPHSVNSQDSIFYNLVKNVRVLNMANVSAGSYKIKINSISKNEISIFDLTNNTLIGTWSTDVNAEFKEAIPGIGFDMYSFRDIEGLSEMYGTKDINDLSGSTVYITTLAGIINPDVPAVGTSYYVSYKYAKSEKDYEPKIFDNYADVLTEYGKYTVTISGNVINSLSLGAEIAMQNGATPIVLVQAKNETDQAMMEAIDKLAKKVGFIDNINAIVPLTISRTVGNYLSQHVTYLSSPEYNMYRIGYLAATANEPISKEPTISNQLRGSIQTAQNFNNERIVYVVPGMVTKSIIDSITGFSVIKPLPGQYLATAVAALSMKNDPAEPLTNKTIIGFNNLQTFFNEPDANSLASAGCLVLKQEGNTIKVRHGITTHGAIDTLADIQSNEITLVQIKDYVIDGCRKTLGELYVGGKLKPSIVHDIEYTIKNLLNQYIADNIIINVEGLTVKRDLDDPRQVNVKFLIEAVYPLNYVDISFGFSTTIS